MSASHRSFAVTPKVSSVPPRRLIPKRVLEKIELPRMELFTPITTPPLEQEATLIPSMPLKAMTLPAPAGVPPITLLSSS